MKKRWVKRKMNKALTMITLASSVALMSPMLVQTGTIVYAVSQDQPMVLVDTEAGKLDYTYQIADTNIHWSLSINEKKAADSAYLRLKIDSVNSINVAGQSIGKDASGWFVLDAATGSAKSYQVDFVTANNGSQELPVAAELVTPGEEGAEDQVQSLVTNGTLKAEIPVVTELPEVETDPTESLEDPVAGENGEAGAETVVGEEAEEAPPADTEPDAELDAVAGNVSGGERSAAEVMPFGVSSGVTNEIRKSNGSSIINNSGSIGNTYATAGEEITFTSSFTLRNHRDHSDYEWGFTINTGTIDVDTLRLYRKIGDGTEEEIRNPSITDGKYTVGLSNPRRDTEYRYRITANAKTLNEDKKGEFSSQVTYDVAKSPYRGESSDKDSYWVKKAESPTYLSWEEIDSSNTTKTSNTVNNHNPDTAYEGSFYWKDLNTSDGISYRIYKGDTQIGNDLTVEGNDTSGSIGFTIPIAQLNSGGNEFTIRAYKGRNEIDRSKRLDLTINCESPTYLSWSMIDSSNTTTTGWVVENYNPITAYEGRFYWKDLDTSAGISYRIYKGDTQVGNDLTVGGNGTSGSKTFTIPTAQLNDRKNEFTIRAYKGQTEIDSSKRLTLTINCESPTVLSWEQGAIKKEHRETKDIVDLTSGYAGTFYWEDQDDSDNVSGALTFKVLKTVLGVESVVATATQNPDGSGTFNIPSSELGYGEKNFTVQAYKGKVKTGDPITLQITVNGSVKLKSVPTDLSWNTTVEQSKGAAISRSGDMTLKVQDSRSATEKASNPWKLTVSSQLQNTPFSLVWQDGETLVDGVELQKTESWTSTGFVDSKTYGADQGILLKSTDYLPVDTWNHQGAITWSLNNVGTTE